MIGTFARVGGGFVARVDAEHNSLLQQLVREILVVLDEPGDLTTFVRAATDLEASRPEPDSPALDNLLPPLSEDGGEAGRLRALTEDFLRSEKSTRLRRLLCDLQSADDPASRGVWVPGEAVWDWLAALNDLRLALAGEMGIATEDDVDAVWDVAGGGAHADPRRVAMCVAYAMVTWWQDSLLRAMRRDAAAH